ncbi:hypothetical protein [Halococcus agarilyticus]|uniref:hypothetical protein n=1 Tax=Halococcus agarilyticus TaxID=1232219 RepID=UPI000677A6AE|nr:hypothetical protein [Halococcus agarilyticus]
MKTIVKNPDITAENKIDNQGRVFVGREHSGRTLRLVGELVEEPQYECKSGHIRYEGQMNLGVDDEEPPRCPECEHEATKIKEE